MRDTVTNQQAGAPQWRPLGELGGRQADTPVALLLTSKEIDGTWLGIVVRNRPAVPEILMRAEVAHHGVMRWAERAAADPEFGRRTCDEGQLLGTGAAR